MRPWLLLLLLSPLVSDLSPLRDGDRVMENWSFCRNLLLNGRMTPRGLQILKAQSERCRMSIQRNSVCVSVQHKQRTSPFQWAHTVCDDYGCSLSNQEFMGIIFRNQIPAPVVSLLCGKRRSAQTLKVLHVMDEPAHIPMRMIKHLPYSASAWFLHHHTAASGHNFQAFLLERSLSWAPAITVKLQKLLTERKCAAETVVISCCFKEREVKRAQSIKRTSKEKGQKRQKESKQRAMGFKVLLEHKGQAFKAAPLHPLDKSQLQTQRNALRIRKKNEHLSFLLQKTAPRQQTLKASSVYDDDDGFYVKRKPLLVPREQPESINKPQYKIRATLDDNKEDFSGKIITKQAELRRPEGESATERSHKNIENGNQGRLAYVLQAGVDNNDDKQMLSEVGDDVLIVLFLRREAQTEREDAADADIRWKTVNIPIKELHDPAPVTEFIEENFIIYSRFKCVKETPSLLEIYALERTERKDIKPAEVITESEKRVKATTEKMEHTETNNTPRENMSINHTKQDAPSEESVIPTPPSVKMIEMETAKTETPTVNKEIKETTPSTDVFNQSSTREADGPPRTTTASPDSEPRFIRCRPNANKQTTNEKSFPGLRMREDFSVKLHKGRENKARAATSRPENERKDTRHDPTNSFTSAEHLKTTHKQDAPLKTTPADTPPCRGLIHRTEAGWRHCAQRHTRDESKIFSTTEPTGSFKDTGQPLKGPPSIEDHGDNDDDEYDHFYYIDGVMKRVRNNFYPYDKRRRLRKRKEDNTENGVFKETLLRYIRRLTARNKDSHGG